MEGSQYVDIFATKGIEYIIVIVFLLSLVYFLRFLNRPARVSSSSNVPDKSQHTLVDWFYLAENFYYHQGHSWTVPENNSVVRVGMDDFAQKLLGKPNKVNLPQIGSKIEQGNVGWQLQIDSKSIDMLSPVNGEVVEVNEEILNSPELINDDPYEKGWLLKIKVPKLETNLKNLLTGKLARAWMEDTVDKLSEKTTGNIGVALQDGGVPITGFIKEISSDDWEEFANEFLFSGDIKL